MKRAATSFHSTSATHRLPRARTSGAPSRLPRRRRSTRTARRRACPSCAGDRARRSPRTPAWPPRRDEHVLLGVGATHALSCVARVVLDAGDEVLLASPYWPLAHGIISQTGARAVEVPLTGPLYRDPFGDAAALLAAATTEHTRALHVISPNNPDGRVLSRAHAGRSALRGRARPPDPTRSTPTTSTTGSTSASRRCRAWPSARDVLFLEEPRARRGPHRVRPRACARHRRGSESLRAHRVQRACCDATRSLRQHLRDGGNRARRGEERLSTRA